MDQQSQARPNGSLIQPPPAAEAFYSEVLQLMAKSEIPFLVSGTYALASYTGIDRPTKDVDVFAKAGDALKMLHYFKEHGFDVEIVDERWLYRDHARRAVRRHHHQHADGHDARHRRMVRRRSGGRAVRREGQARPADPVHLVEDLRPGPSPLRHAPTSRT